MKDNKKAGNFVFITLYSHDAGNVFGEIEDRRIVLSPAGEVVVKWAVVLGDEFGVKVEAFTVMPNHMHILVEAGQPDTGAEKNGEAASEMAVWFMNMTSEEMAGRGILKGAIWKKEFSCHMLENASGLEHAREHISKDSEHWHDSGNQSAGGRHYI